MRNEEAVELRLWAENDGEFYRQRLAPVYNNLAKKMLDMDTYSPVKACNFLANVLKDAAKSYGREFLADRQNGWKSIFPAWVRREAADAMLHDLMAEVELGNWPVAS